MKLRTKLSIVLGVFALLLIASCAKKEPSLLKIFVKSSSITHVENITVRIVGDLDKDTPEYLEEKKSNENGLAQFNLDDFYSQYGKKDEKVAYFNVYIKDTVGYFDYVGNVKTKANITSTETVYLK